MEIITNIANSYYLPLLIVGIVMVLSLIGYISTKVKEKGMTKLGNDISMLDNLDEQKLEEDTGAGVNLQTGEDK